MEEMAYPGGASGWRRTFVLLAAIAVVAVGIIVVAQRPASAHDHQPPKTVLMKGSKELQSGRKVEEYIWAYPTRNGNGCFVDEATFPFGFPKEVPTVAAGSKLKVRIHNSQAPRPFAMQEVDREGVPRREGKDSYVEVLLKPVVRDGETVAWDAVFSVERANSVYRLVAEGHWQDRDGCFGTPEQFAHWSFRVKTGSAS